MPTMARLDAGRIPPATVHAMLGVEQYVRRSGLDPALDRLVKIRSSYINGCSYCVDMHTKDARAAGETEQRLYAIPVWRDAVLHAARARRAGVGGVGDGDRGDRRAGHGV